MNLTPNALSTRLRGVIAFAPTPFHADERLDLDSLARHVDFLCQSGVKSIVVCGGVGEFFALNYAEHRDVVHTAVESAMGRAIVLAGVGQSTGEACRIAERAAKAGVDGLMVNPMYFIQPSPDGWYSHYAALARATGLGLMVFSTSGASHSPDSLERLAEIPEVVAFKDELGDLKLFGEIVDRISERLVWVNGMAELMLAPYISLGAQAVTSGMINLSPPLSQAIWDAAVEGRLTDLQALLRGGPRRLARLRERRAGYPIMVIKEALNMLGRPGGGFGRLPLTPLLPADGDELRELLATMGLREPAIAAN